MNENNGYEQDAGNNHRYHIQQITSLIRLTSESVKKELQGIPYAFASIIIRIAPRMPFALDCP